MRNVIRRTALGIAAAALVVPAATSVAATTVPAAATTASASTTSSTAYCGIFWGSLAKTSSPLWSGAVAGVRYGRHTCYDRLVFDVSTGVGKLGYRVRYVTSVTSPGSGLPVAVRGGAKLQITVNAPARIRIPSSGTVTFTDWRTFRQLTWVGSFEGYTDFGLGVRARLPMRTFVLDNGDGSKRLVVDIAHRW